MKMIVIPQFNSKGKILKKLETFIGEMDMKSHKAFLFGRPHNLGPLHVWDIEISKDVIRMIGFENYEDRGFLPGHRYVYQEWCCRVIEEVKE